MSESAWRESLTFNALCDLIASDHLVCLTGAGVSRDLLRRNDPSRPLPGWAELLEELFAALHLEIAGDDLTSITRLLDPGAARIGSDELILAATLIRRCNPEKFDRLFREAITEAPGQCSETHEALLELEPRGIMTFNYDGGHESACAKAGIAPSILNPTLRVSEGDFRLAFERRLRDFFLLKAHGSISPPSPLVLTTEAYRDLLVKNPAFKAFVQNLFTNFSFLILGYGLDDPDFALFTRTMLEQFGAPVQEHIVIRRLDQESPREEVERRLFGINTLHIDDYAELPEVLRAAATTAGPSLEVTIAMCLGPKREERERGHDRLRELGAAGRRLAGNVFSARLSDPDSFIVSEAAYSLGVLGARRYKEVLCELVDARREADILGRSITVLREALDPADIPRLNRWLERFAGEPPIGDRPERIVKYLEYLVLYVEHKFKSDPASA